MTVDPELRPSGVDVGLCVQVQHLLSVTSWYYLVLRVKRLSVSSETRFMEIMLQC
jgi:hypothetical protein